jgi:hypothetical protein
MQLDIGKRLFPKASRWQRRRKMGVLIGCVVVGITLVGGVACLVIWLSGVGSFSHPGAGDSRSPLSELGRGK